MKKVLCFTVIAVLLVTACIMCIQNVQAAKEGVFTYTVSKGVAKITACDTSVSGSLEIPSTLGGYPVTSIGDYSFVDCTGLTSIKFPDSVTTIGAYAFSDCTGLTSIEIHAYITNIKDGAFAFCSSLTGINVSADNTKYCSDNGILFNKNKTTLLYYPAKKTNAYYEIPNSVTNIGSFAFNYCSNLTSITIPDSVTNIGCDTFYKCINLTSVEIPNSVTTIGQGAFFYCTNLSAIQIPDSVTSIGDNILHNTSYYKNTSNWENGVLYVGKHLITTNHKQEGTYYIKNGTKTIANYAFNNSIYSNIIIPNSVTNIGDCAFSYCNNLTSIEIPNSVTKLAVLTFLGADNLTNIQIPDSVTSIGSCAFDECTSLTTVYYSGTEEKWNDISIGTGNDSLQNSNIIYKSAEYLTYTVSNGKATITACNKSVSGSLALPSTLGGYPVTSIGDGAFDGCINITSVIIPDTVISIGDNAFPNCSNLTSVVIPNSVTSMGICTFTFCNKLTNVEIGNSLTSIDNYTFGSCSSLTSIVIPNSVTSIGISAFLECNNLTSITIGNSVTSIGNYAFNACNKLTELEIPDSLTSIGDKVFERCYALKEIRVSEKNSAYSSVKGILFNKNMSNLICYPYGRTEASYIIPSSVTSISNSAFTLCNSLTSIVIPTSVTSIGNSAFYYCKGLTTVYYCGTEEQWNKISISSYNESLLDANIVYEYAIADTKITAIENAISGTTLKLRILDNDDEIIIVPTNKLGSAMTVAELKAIFNDPTIVIESNNGIIGTGCKVTIDGYTVEIAVKGDIDGDGIVTAFDANMIKKALANNGFENEALREFAGDVDGTEVTDSADVEGILAHIVGNSYIK